MILDLTRRPMLLIYEQCPQSVVVRTWQTKDAGGRIAVKREEKTRTRGVVEKTQFLEPGASLTRGGITCHETRLSLYEALSAYEARNAPKTWYERVPVPGVSNPNASLFGEPGVLAETELQRRVTVPALDLAAEPFEVATGAKDAISGHLFVWRAAISIQLLKELWLVTVRDVSSEKSVDLCTVGTKSLDPKPPLREDLPLLRLTKKVIGKPQNAWEHLLDDD